MTSNVAKNVHKQKINLVRCENLLINVQLSEFFKATCSMIYDYMLHQWFLN